jgi:hypothetical protein
VHDRNATSGKSQGIWQTLSEKVRVFQVDSPLSEVFENNLTSNSEFSKDEPTPLPVSSTHMDQVVQLAMQFVPGRGVLLLAFNMLVPPVRSSIRKFCFVCC